MGRPKGSKNSSREIDGGADGEERVNTVSGEELHNYITRIEACNEEQKEISADRQQIYKELKAAGYDRDTVREMVRLRNLPPDKRRLGKDLLEEYQAALGDFAFTPLGEAGADRMRSGEARAE